MNELIEFITRYKSIFLFTLLEIVCFSLIFQQKAYQKSWLINSTNVVVGKTYAVSSSVKNYTRLGSINEALAQQNAELLTNPIQVEHFTTPVALNDTLIINDTLFSDTTVRFLHLPAKVIYNTFTNKNNYVILNKGKKHGFFKNMGVVSNKGVLGKVINVSKNYALVMPIINENLTISAMLKTQGHIGTVVWNSKLSFKKAYLKNIPTHVNINQGDTVLSSGYSRIYPNENIIGFVETVQQPQGSNFLDITINLANDYSNLHFVYGVTQAHTVDSSLTNWLKQIENE